MNLVPAFLGVQAMRQRLATARRVMVLGNGGIALELV